MKGGLCAMVYTLANIIKSGKQPAYDITFVGTCDEESTSIGVKTFAASDEFPKVSEVLIGEPTGLNIGIAQKGCLWLEIDILGKASHASYPEKGVNAIEYGMRIATELKKRITERRHELLGSVTAQMSKISGGETVNVTPDKCTISMDIRFVPGQDESMILNWLDDISQNYMKETKGDALAVRDLLFKTDEFIFSYRVAGILQNGDKIFLQKYKNDYTFVGGHVLGMETHEAALKREFMEELQVNIGVDNLAAIGENFFTWDGTPWHQICFYYRIHLEGENTLQMDGMFHGEDEWEDGTFELDFCWVPMNALDKIHLIPEEMVPCLLKRDENIVHFVSKQ